MFGEMTVFCACCSAQSTPCVARTATRRRALRKGCLHFLGEQRRTDLQEKITSWHEPLIGWERSAPLE